MEHEGVVGGKLNMGLHINEYTVQFLRLMLYVERE